MVYKAYLSLRYKIKRKKDKFKESRFLLATLMLAIGVSGTISYYEYTEYKANAFEPIVIKQIQVIEKSNGTMVEDSAEVFVSPNEGEVSHDLSGTEGKICEVFPDNCEVMIAIAKAESNLRTDALNTKNSNGSTDSGLFQINSIHGYSHEYLIDVDNNLAVAKSIYDKQGITAWSAYNNKSYLKYM